MQDEVLTTSAGAPVADDDNAITAGPRGPLTFDNVHVFEKLAHFNRERIPERVVHARGTGAYGTFQLSQSLSEFTSADFLQSSGTVTDVFVRFSTVGGGQDSSDYARDPRGFAVKFYTRQGNFDLVGNNTPVFFLNDPSKFPDFVHSQKKHPRSNLPDPARMYEFWANHRQSLHQLTILMSDRGIPRSYRHMNGYGSHTLSFWNVSGERFWVKWHFKTAQGIECVTDRQAAELPAYGAQQDLFEAIERGEFPSWTVKLQVLSESAAHALSVNPFDLTKVWPHAEAPLLEIGTLSLNRNVENYFAETEQAAFSPGNLVPGIGASPDKMLQARLLAYPDAQRYRVGVNATQLPVNAPRCPVRHYQRDGSMAGMPSAFGGHHNQGSGVNFYPNDRTAGNEPAPAAALAPPALALHDDTWVKAHEQLSQDYHSQAGALYRQMSETQREQLIGNIASGLSAATDSVKHRMLEQFRQADGDYGARVEDALRRLD